jgi:hypothetical protein
MMNASFGRRWPARTLVLAAAVALATMGSPTPAEGATCSAAPTRLTTCVGTYALCDATACTSLSRPTEAHPVAQCECAVRSGPALADLSQLAGGSCSPPAGTLYALLSTADTPAPQGAVACPGGSYAGCWNASCSWKPGDTVAHCTCALCAGSFTTWGASCSAANCTAKLLVATPFPVQGSTCQR